MITKYSCRDKIRRVFGKAKCVEISPDYPSNRSTQTCTDRATLIEHFFLTGEYLRSAGVAEYQFPDGVDDGSEIVITRLQSVQSPELSQLSHEVNTILDRKQSDVIESIYKLKQKESASKSVVKAEGNEHNE